MAESSTRPEERTAKGAWSTDVFDPERREVNTVLPSELQGINCGKKNILDKMQYISYIQIMETSANMNMKLARVEKGLSQEELAELAGATRQTIGLIEKGKYNPSLNLCIRIARALDRTLDQLFWKESNGD